MQVFVVGGGIFGVTAALVLRDRPGTNLGESIDTSKVIRIDHGGDEDYTELDERALAPWRRSSSPPASSMTAASS